MTDNQLHKPQVAATKELLSRCETYEEVPHGSGVMIEGMPWWAYIPPAIVVCFAGAVILARCVG